MAKIVVNYQALGVVQSELTGIYGQLDSMWDTLEAAQTAINEIGDPHDEVFSAVSDLINNQLEVIEFGGLEAIEELNTKTGEVISTFFDEEGNIIANLDNIPDNLSEYFGIEEDPNGYTITADTGADTSDAAESTVPSGGGGSTGAVPGTGGTSTVPGSQDHISSEVPHNETNSSDSNKDDNDTDNEENVGDIPGDSAGRLPSNDNGNGNNNNSSNNNNSNNNDNNSKNGNTFKDAKENAQNAGNSNPSKDITAGGVVGGAAIGAATTAANTAGSTSGNDDGSGTDKETIKGEALGDTVVGDDALLNEEDFAGLDSGVDNDTHQTSPIDVSIDKESGTSVIPTLAGVVAAGLAGVGTKAVLDKKDKDDEDEEDEEGETYSGDYEAADGNGNNLLDSSDDIGFNPDAIIEEGESGGLANDVYPDSVIEDMQPSNDRDSGFNAMPALAGAAGAGLAGVGLVGLLKKEDDEDEEEEKEDPKDFE